MSGMSTDVARSGRMPGQIVFLNGTTSSGKSSIAAELLRILQPPYFHLAVDAVNAMRSRQATARLDPPQLDEVLWRTRAGFHRAVAGMAAAGNHVVVDHVLSQPWRLADCLVLLADFDVVFVGVRCPLDELERRERARGDRQPGVAAQQWAVVHAHGDYDIECDTAEHSPFECAEQIAAFLARPVTSRAFDRLRRPDRLRPGRHSGAGGRAAVDR